jgi:hypothetical protein
MEHGKAYAPTFGKCAVRTGGGKGNEHQFANKLVTKDEIKQEYSELTIVTVASFAEIRAGSPRSTLFEEMY